MEINFDPAKTKERGFYLSFILLIKIKIDKASKAKVALVIPYYIDYPSKSVQVFQRFSGINKENWIPNNIVWDRSKIIFSFV